MINLCEKSKDMNYQKFRREFEESGLTQKAYANKIGKSPSMVHYYLRRALKGTERTKIGSFQELTVDQNMSNKEIKITTPAGIEIVIPI